jgi:hypothetical protein
VTLFASIRSLKLEAKSQRIALSSMAKRATKLDLLPYNIPINASQQTDVLSGRSIVSTVGDQQKRQYHDCSLTAGRAGAWISSFSSALGTSLLHSLTMHIRDSLKLGLISAMITTDILPKNSNAFSEQDVIRFLENNVERVEQLELSRKRNWKALDQTAAAVHDLLEIGLKFLSPVAAAVQSEIRLHGIN